MIINTSGGGAGLNFKIVGGTTQPGNPGENTIWVNTGVAITGWAFSSEAPASPANGMVWFQTGISSTTPFNAVKKNSIELHPLRAQQYISGAWTDKAAKTYQGGAWVAWWSGMLYDAGDEWTSITGGWTQTGYKEGTLDNPTVEKRESELVWNVAQQSFPVIGTENEIGLSMYSVLKMEYYVSFSNNATNNIRLMVSSSKINVESNKTHFVLADTSIGAHTASVDISTADKGYVAVSSYVQGGITLSVQKVWLE